MVFLVKSCVVRLLIGHVDLIPRSCHRSNTFSKKIVARSIFGLDKIPTFLVAVGALGLRLNYFLSI